MITEGEATVTGGSAAGARVIAMAGSGRDLPEPVSYGHGILDGSDEALAAAARYDRDLFGQLYHRYADRLYRYALGRTRSATTADDIVSDTMMAAMEGLHGYDPDKGSFAGWLFTIASRRIIDRERKQRQFWRYLSRRPLDPVEHESALDSALRSEQQELVRDAISRLSDRHREIVLLRYVADLPIRDISEVLDISEGAVKMRLQRAMQQLSRELGDADDV